MKRKLNFQEFQSAFDTFFIRTQNSFCQNECSQWQRVHYYIFIKRNL
jgi:hypothetical protein